MNWLNYLTLIVFFCFTSGDLQAEATDNSSKKTVRYLLGHDEVRLPDLYPQHLLQAVIEGCGSGYQLERSEISMLQGRAAMEIAEDPGSLSVVWTMTSSERESLLKPVPIPIYRGLLGFRVLVVRRQDLARFSHIRTIEQLKELRAVQGYDWPDIEILRANALPVDGYGTTSEMYRLLKEGFVDYFPRAVIEVDRELEVLNDDSFAVLPDIALIYPTAGYFFTNHSDIELNTCLTQSMEKMIASGDFMTMFERYFGQSLRRYRYAEMATIVLANPLLETTRPINRKYLDHVATEVYKD
ncbi:hypothetical protein EZV61_14340 [Corallincola luteus]|uniref:Solute-binding protein family 3/N-terminal domain-containing protein n=1 Tax=Corallincola luteus TaxID=1775177 RepID=A0ABY2AIK5_9GAMM|nr:ABC transporter substrate-binding protein [Corallincola luteus]TCI02528.1 hypothetical protein EZV61_14340 [Corallincola luteus]